MKAIAARRPRLVAGLSLLAAAGAGLAGWVLAAGGGEPATGFPVVSGAHGLVATTSATLKAELRAHALHFTGVACVRNGRSFAHEPIVRCNVDFGDPHIEAYCTVIERGRLVTNFDDRSIPCGHDNAGFEIITYPPDLARGASSSPASGAPRGRPRVR